MVIIREQENTQTDTQRNITVTYNPNGSTLVECMKNIIINKKITEKV